MKKVIDIAIADLQVTFKDNSIWLNLVVIPIVLIMVIGFVSGGPPGSSSGGSSDLPIDVFDNDNSDLSASFLTTLQEVNPNIVVCPMDNDAEDDPCNLDETESLTIEAAVARVENNNTLAIIEIPEGFGAHVLSGDMAEVVYRSDEDPTQPSFLSQSVQAAAQRVGGASVAARVAVDVYEDSAFEFEDESDRNTFQQAVYEDASAIWAEPPATISFEETLADESDSGGSSAGGFGQSVPGIGSMYVMFTVLAGAVVLLQERQNWTLQRLITMPVSRVQIMGGKMLARFIMGLIQYAVAFGTGFLIGASFGDEPLAILLIMMAFTLCFTAISLLLATFVESEQQAGTLVTFLALILAPLGGAWWPLEIVPDFMQTLALASPVGWAMTGFNEVIFNGGGIVDVWVNVAVLLVAAAVIFVIGIMNFEYEQAQ